jgi:hypothetical protein
MTADRNAGGDTLLDVRPRPPEEGVATRPGRRVARLLVVVVIGALGAVGVWAISPDDGPGGAPRVLSDHDSHPTPWQTRQAFLDTGMQGERAQPRAPGADDCFGPADPARGLHARFC